MAESLGGKRRFRTMEGAGSYNTLAPDVYFPKKVRRKNPKVKQVAVECKKRRTLNVHALFAEATMKYAEEGKKRIIFASKVPRGRMGAAMDKLESDVEKRYRVGGPVWKRLIQKRKTELKLKGKKLDKVGERKVVKRLLRKAKAALRIGKAHTRCKHNIAALVTVELDFFKTLWEAWLKEETDV